MFLALDGLTPELSVQSAFPIGHADKGNPEVRPVFGRLTDLYEVMAEKFAEFRDESPWVAPELMRLSGLAPTSDGV